MADFPRVPPVPPSDILQKVFIHDSNAIRTTTTIVGLSTATLFKNGRVSLTANERHQLVANFPDTKAISIQSHPDNTDYIYLGDITVDDTNGYVLNIGESIQIDFDSNSSSFYLFSKVSANINYLVIK